MLILHVFELFELKTTFYSDKSSHRPVGIPSKALSSDGRKKSDSTMSYGDAGTCSVSINLITHFYRGLTDNVPLIYDTTTKASNFSLSLDTYQ